MENKNLWKFISIGVVVVVLILLLIVLIPCKKDNTKPDKEKKSNMVSTMLQEESDRSSIYDLVKQIEDKQRTIM